jgi:hypothetical protein
VSNSFASSASEFSSSSSTGAFGFEGSNTGAVDVGGGNASRSSVYESSSYSTGGDVYGLGNGSPSYESSSYSPVAGGLTGGVDALFAAVDTNNDGVLSRSEFQNAGF